MTSNKYEIIFNTAPVGIWEEDWSGIKILFDPLRSVIPKDKIMEYLDAHPDFVKQLAQSIRVLRVNKKTAEMHEADSPEFMMNADLTQTFTQGSFHVFKNEMAALYRGDEIFEMETEKKTLKGNPIYLLIKIALPQADQDYSHVIVVMTDICDKRHNSLILTENIQKYKDLLDSTNAAYLILNEEGEIKEISENFVSIFGKSYEDSCLLGKCLRGLVSAESIYVFDSAWKRILKGKTVNAVEIALTKKDTFRWVSLNASMLQNGCKKVFVLLTDITERKRKEFERLIHREKYRDKIRNNIKDIRNTIERMENR